MGAQDKDKTDDVVRLFVKAGVDGERMGACPFCQRVYMVMMVKAQHGLLKFQVIACSPAKPPDELTKLGLKHLPAIVHLDEGFDAEDDIVQYIDDTFPGGGLVYDSPEAEIACKDFFSKFCFFIKAVNQDSSKLDHALEKLDAFLEAATPPCSPLASSPPPPKSPTTPSSPALTAKNLSSLSGSTASSFASPAPSFRSSVGSSNSPVPSSGPSSPLPAGKSVSRTPAAYLPTTSTNWPVVNTSSSKLFGGSTDSGAESLCSESNELQWLTGPGLSHLDCVVLPKLQHLRVAAAALKAYQIPTRFRGLWRYLHNAYNNPVFAQTCPCDQEIVLHWHDRLETKKMSHKKHAELAKEKPKFSFDVPVRASVVTVVEVD
ncbi:chloride intracellular channel protein 2-like isoform X1 [Hyalella azteca]|uniref:Chloride intracellular channel protein 2-like isoform X1 n=1 Tax=Hyalella azteca TaxID=294128 RepID=A0A8B7N200_HYAAZ|nr:chloride intracellular channel protein 2-like isoform X1 [Hyalella azteca]